MEVHKGGNYRVFGAESETPHEGGNENISDATINTARKYISHTRFPPD